jgi:hypothetical protein
MQKNALFLVKIGNETEKNESRICQKLVSWLVILVRPSIGFFQALLVHWLVDNRIVENICQEHRLERQAVGLQEWNARARIHSEWSFYSDKEAGHPFFVVEASAELVVYNNSHALHEIPELSAILSDHVQYVLLAFVLLAESLRQPQVPTASAAAASAASSHIMQFCDRFAVTEDSSVCCR